MTVEITQRDEPKRRVLMCEACEKGIMPWSPGRGFICTDCLEDIKRKINSMPIYVDGVSLTHRQELTARFIGDALRSEHLGSGRPKILAAYARELADEVLGDGK